jgi:hypothetical protein
VGEQTANLARVRSAIARHVLTFCWTRVMMEPPTFRMNELQTYVSDQASAAPASPDRILRALRAEGLIDYVVEDRAKSLYRLTRVSEGG